MSAPAPTAPPPPRPRFYRRRRFWAWSGLGVLAMAAGVAVLLYWLLQTVAGRDVLLAQIIARLPAGATLTWEKVEGPIVGPLTLHGLDFRYQDYRFTARRAYLDPDIRPLLGRRLRLDALEIEGATLNLARSDEPFELPRWPESLPAIEMPIAIQADRIVIDGFDITSGGEHVIDIRTLRGGIDIANGSLHAEQLKIDSDLGLFTVHGSYEPVHDYRSDLLVTAVLPAPHGRSPVRLGLVARGDLSQMEVGIGGRAPEPLRATLTLGGDEDAPTWRLLASSQGLDPVLFTGGEPAPDAAITFDLQASGTGGAADLSGQLGRGGQQVTIAPSHVQLENQVLTVAPLALELYGGTMQLKGRADFSDPEDGRFRFALNAQGLVFEAEDPAAPAIGVDAALGVAGSLDNWAAYGDAVLRRGDQQADLVLDVRGDQARAQIHALQATMPTGTLQATGEAGWDPVLDWNLALVLDGFDPGYFAPGWDGNVNGRIATTGEARDAGGFDAQVDVQSLGGRLRGRALSGNGRFALRGDQGEGQLALALGNSRVRANGRVGDRLDITAQLDPLQLDDLLPTAAGTVQGSLRLTGTRQAPHLRADLQGRGLRWDDWSAGAVDLQGQLPWRGSNGDLSLRGTELQVGIPVRQLDVQAQGAIENLRLQVQADSPDTAGLSLSGQLQRRGASWNGSLDQFGIEPARGNTWSLQAPAAFTVTGPRWQLQPACLGTRGDNGEAQLCAEADWPRQGLSVTSERLPLTLLEPWLPEQGGRALVLRGELSLDAQLKPQGNRWVGGVHIASPEGGVRLGNNARREIARYDNFSFDLEFDPQKIQGRLGTGFQGNGYVDATFNTGWEPYSPLTGELYTYISQLFWLELFSPDLVRPRGVVRGHMSLRGTRSEPLMAGQLLLEDFQGELPALGLSLTDGQGSLDAQADGAARLSASVGTGGGKLHVDGRLSWFGQATPLELDIHGQDVLIADTPMLKATANPDLQFSMDGPTMVLRGQVEVTQATANLERFEQGATVSEDVVVVDPVDPEEQRSAPLDMDLALILGDDVTLSGYGLQGTMGGRLQVRSRPGHEMRATGALEVGGRYKAYGQDLTITHGQLTWSNDQIADPRINLRAERRVGDVVAGIDVAGRATEPQLNVWSNPSMPQSEALAYLMLGRSLEGATRDQAQQVTATSAAMSAGTGLLAAQLGTRLGFDDAGVMHSRALGGSVVGVGKYLSPRLYVGYGVSMVGAGQVVILKYLLRKGFDVELESSTIETRGSVNWRTER